MSDSISLTVTKADGTTINFSGSGAATETVPAPPQPPAPPIGADLAIELQSGWASHIPSDGSGVDNGAPDPTLYVPRPLLCPDGSAYFYFYGPAASTCEWYIKRPIQVGKQPTLSFDLTPDSDAANLQLFETDLIAWEGGRHYNGSLQNYKGQLEVGAGSGGWQATGLQPGLYAPGKTHHVQVDFGIVWGKSLSVKTVTIDGKAWNVPVQNQNAAVNPTTWGGEAVLFQLQLKMAQTVQGTARAGVFLKNLNLVWN